MNKNKIKKKLVFAVPCRNTGRRLFGKPIQFIDPDRKITIIEQLISCIKKINSVSDIVLGISYGSENKIFEKIAKIGLFYQICFSLNMANKPFKSQKCQISQFCESHNS